jgi:hypothetical protein
MIEASCGEYGLTYAYSRMTVMMTSRQPSVSNGLHLGYTNGGFWMQGNSHT